MKNNYLQILVLVLLVSVSRQLSAQQLITAGNFVVQGVEYTISPRTEGEYGLILISRTHRNSQQQNREVVDGIPLSYIETRVTNEEVYKQMVLEILGDTKVRALELVGEMLDFSFYFTPNGKILNLSIAVKTTTLTLDDIAKIDKVLRKNYTATFKSINDGHQHMYYIPINSEIYFSR